MPLTPEDVQNKEFMTVRLREGYDMTEVDEFLDEVEAELARLTRENEELREKLSAVTRGGPVSSAEPIAAPRQPQPPQPKAPPVPPPAVVGGSPHEAAAKVLALAQKTADELVADAKSEADRLLGDARTRAQQLDADTKMKSSKAEADLRERQQQIESEAQQRRERLFGQLEAERERLELEVEQLRGFEREYRSRLKAYLEGQLRHLEASGSAESSPAPAATQAPSPPARVPAARPQNSEPEQKSVEATAGGPARVPSLLEEEQPRG